MSKNGIDIHLPLCMFVLSLRYAKNGDKMMSSVCLAWTLPPICRISLFRDRKIYLTEASLENI